MCTFHGVHPEERKSEETRHSTGLSERLSEVQVMQHKLIKAVCGAGGIKVLAGFPEDQGSNFRTHF